MSQQEVITKTTNEVVEFNEFEAKLVEYKKQYEGIIYDFSDENQKKSAKEDKKAIAKTVKGLDDTHKEAKADLLSATRLLDGERKRIKDGLLVLKDGITEQEEEHANIAIKHAAMLHEKVTDIENLTVLQDDIFYDFNQLLSIAKDIVIDSSFESREADGHMAKAKTIEFFEAKIALFEKQERIAKEEKEAADKAQQEREEGILKEAEAKAVKEKEAAALKAKADAKTAKKKAEADKKAAVKAEKEKAEKAAKEKEAAARKEVERLQALADAEAEKVKAKQENQNHRAKIHKAAKESFIAAGFNHGTELVNAIKDGKIKNVTINY